MPSPAVDTDVENRWRPLTDAERIVANTKLADAWRMLKRQLAKRGIDIETLIASDADVRDEVIRVLAEAVIWALLNPDRLSQESIDDYAATRASNARPGVPPGELGFTAAELEALSPGLIEQGQAFTIDPLADYAERWA